MTVYKTNIWGAVRKITFQCVCSVKLFIIARIFLPAQILSAHKTSDISWLKVCCAHDWLVRTKLREHENASQRGFALIIGLTEHHSVNLKLLVIFSTAQNYLNTSRLFRRRPQGPHQ